MLTKKEIKVKNRTLIIAYTKWFSPYLSNGKTALKSNTKAKRGLYFIKSRRTGKIVYVGYSNSSLYKTLYRHFQSWKDRQYRATFRKSDYVVKIILSKSSLISDLEKFYIDKYKPTKNAQLYKEYDLPKVQGVPNVENHTALEPFDAIERELKF